MTAERLCTLAKAMTEQAREDALESIALARESVVRIPKLCKRAGISIPFDADELTAGLDEKTEALTSAGFFQCGPLVDEATMALDEPLSSLEVSVLVQTREQKRTEARIRSTIRDAATVRLRAIQAADKALERNTTTARTRTAKLAHTNAVYTIWFQFVTFGVVTGLIGALIATRLPEDGAQQEQGLLLAVFASVVFPLVLYVVVKCQTPGLADWMRLMEQKEYDRELPRKEDELKAIRQTAIESAESKYRTATRSVQRDLESTEATMSSLDALQVHIRALREQPRL